MDDRDILQIIDLIQNKVPELWIESIKPNRITFKTSRNLQKVLSDIGDIWNYYQVLRNQKSNKLLLIEHLNLKIYLKHKI